MSVVIIHNPRCSKSRQTLELLKENGVEPEVREYLKQPLSIEELSSILEKLSLSMKQAMRTKEAEFKELNLDRADISEQELINAVANTPKLLERPIVINGGKAAIGRPPENVLAIL
jgi:arsenate reductase